MTLPEASCSVKVDTVRPSVEYREPEASKTYNRPLAGTMTQFPAVFRLEPEIRETVVPSNRQSNPYQATMRLATPLTANSVMPCISLVMLVVCHGNDFQTH